MKKEHKILSIKVAVSSLSSIAASFLPLEHKFKLLVFMLPLLIIGFDVFREAVEGILHKELPGECFLMSVAAIGALLTGEYLEGVAVMVLFCIGEAIEDFAKEHSQKSIKSLLDLRPDSVCVIRDSVELRLPPEEVEVGELISVMPGERIPLDGIIKSGASSIDTSSLTGEAIPVDVASGDSVHSGCINKNGHLIICTSKSFGESTAARILKLVKSSSEKKARAEGFIRKFARIYTPVVVLSAVLLAAIPPLLFNADFTTWFQRALTFLVSSCPCALVISIPLTFLGGIAGISKQGVLIKGGNYLEALCKVDTVIFDKTGTLTKGEFKVRAIRPVGQEADELLATAALAESKSSHPIAASVRLACAKPIDSTRLEAVTEIPGEGVRAIIDGKPVAVGNLKLMQGEGLTVAEGEEIGTKLYVSINKQYAGYIVIADEIKDEAAPAIAQLKAQGIRKIAMLTGDNFATAEKEAAKLKIDEFHAELLPEQKLVLTEQLLDKKSTRGSLLFVGDGINDAPSLMRADVGVAMGAMGSDAAVEAADVVLMDDKLQKIASAIRAARFTHKIAVENIVFSIGVKAAVLLLCALGITDMWAAVFADVGVMLIAVLNSTRSLRVKGKK